LATAAVEDPMDLIMEKESHPHGGRQLVVAGKELDDPKQLLRGCGLLEGSMVWLP
jgi:hypothetical protein